MSDTKTIMHTNFHIMINILEKLLQHPAPGKTTIEKFIAHDLQIYRIQKIISELKSFLEEETKISYPNWV